MKMEAIAEVQFNASRTRSRMSPARQRERAWQGALAASILLCVVLVCVSIGVAVESEIGLLNGRTSFKVFEAVCLAGVLAAAFFAAHCLDKIRAVRIEIRKQQIPDRHLRSENGSVR